MAFASLQSKISEAIEKRAAAAEVTKEAFLLPLAVNMGRIVAPMAGSVLARRGLSRIAPSLANRSGMLGSLGKKLPGFLERPFSSALAVDMPAMGLTSLAAEPIFKKVEDAYSQNSQSAASPSFAEMNKLSSLNKEAFIKGFVKAAAQNNVSHKDFSILFKAAFQSPDQMTSDDFASIKNELASRGVAPVYDDFLGDKRRAYNEALLKARDAASREIPALSGAAAGLKGGLLGGALGGAGGYAAGKLLKNAPFLNLSGNARRALPGALGGAGALVSAILATMPAAKQKYDAVQALQKLRNTGNVHESTAMNTADQYLLNS